MLYIIYILLLILISMNYISSNSLKPTYIKDNEYGSYKRHSDLNICRTNTCIKSARMIIKNMNSSINPCDNFYIFACGNYIKFTNIPDDKSTVNIPHTIGDLLEDKLRRIFEQPSTINELRPFTIIKKLYQTCMNTAAIENDSIRVLQKYLRRFKGWPVLEGENWNSKRFDWQENTYELHEAGFGTSYLLRIYAFLDPKNSSQTILFIHQALLGLKREYLIRGHSDKLVRAYFSYMVDTAVMLGAEKDFALKELKNSLNFEMQLAEISLAKEDLRNFTTLYNPISIRKLQQEYPGIQWLKYINKLLHNIKVSENEILILQAPKYVKGLLDLLQKTPKRVQANYLLWRVVENSVSFLNSQLRNRLLHYTKVVSGTTALPPRWRECVAVINNGIPIAVGALYIRTYFTRNEKIEAEYMVQNIRKELRHILKNVEWMDDRTLDRALQKLDTMEAHIGYPDELLNNTLLDEYYDKLRIYENQYLESVLEITKFERLYEFRSLHSSVNKSSWVDHSNAAVVNAFYTFSENSINLPAGILQEAFFSNDRPRYLNYGAIGSVIGHEIIHGYDDKGRQYDKNGNLIDWWEDVTSQNFVKRAQCFIDQYSNFEDSTVNLNLNGVNTQGENIADNGGVKAAYQAYSRWLRRTQIKEPSLPGLEFTSKQMFWLSMANAFCSKSRPEYTQLIITTDEHSPAMFRVLGTLSNLQEFATDFKCPSGSRMNPIKKCILW